MTTGMTTGMTTAGTAGSVWGTLVGQRRTVASLRAAAEGRGMSHAFLFTGPPGSGRSNAAVAFAAALQCEEQPPGCGTCHSCHTVLAGSHADVTVVRTDRLSIGVDEVRDLVRRSALAPVGRRWQVMIVEDADRLTDQAATALLKAIEEPTDRTVWILCAPTVEDLLPTIRSRCRLVTLSTPSAEEVADFLVRSDGVGPALASYCARASQGHIGRARALARDEGARNRRKEVVSIPARLTSLASCMNAAQNLVETTQEEADLITGELDARERVDLDASYGVVERGRRPREYAPAAAALERAQKTRAKRRHLDVVDRGLMDLVSVYRDAIAVATGAGIPLVNEEIRPEVDLLARTSSPELNLRRIGWIFDAREQMLEFNVPVPLALESMMVALKAPAR
jgi:DNA polymerase III subunit delta'